MAPFALLFLIVVLWGGQRQIMSLCSRQGLQPNHRAMRPQPDKEILRNVFPLPFLIPPDHPPSLKLSLYPTSAHCTHIHLAELCHRISSVTTGKTWRLRGISDYSIFVNKAVIGNNCNCSSAAWASVSEPRGERDGNKSKTEIGISLKNQYKFDTESHKFVLLVKFWIICCCDLQ